MSIRRNFNIYGSKSLSHTVKVSPKAAESRNLLMVPLSNIITVKSSLQKGDGLTKYLLLSNREVEISRKKDALKSGNSKKFKSTDISSEDVIVKKSDYLIKNLSKRKNSINVKTNQLYAKTKPIKKIQSSVALQGIYPRNDSKTLKITIKKSNSPVSDYKPRIIPNSSTSKHLADLKNSLKFDFSIFSKKKKEPPKPSVPHFSMKSFIEQVIKIQSAYRKKIARDRYHLLKNKPNLLKTLVLRFGSIILHIKVLKQNENYVINSYNGVTTATLKIPITEPLSEIISNLDFSDNVLKSRSKKTGSLTKSNTNTKQATISKRGQGPPPIRNHKNSETSFSISSHTDKVKISIESLAPNTDPFNKSDIIPVAQVSPSSIPIKSCTLLINSRRWPIKYYKTPACLTAILEYNEIIYNFTYALTKPIIDLSFFIDHSINNYLVPMNNALTLQYPLKDLQKTLLYSCYYQKVLENEYFLSILKVSTGDYEVNLSSETEFSFVILPQKTLEGLFNGLEIQFWRIPAFVSIKYSLISLHKFNPDFKLMKEFKVKQNDSEFPIEIFAVQGKHVFYVCRCPDLGLKVTDFVISKKAFLGKFKADIKDVSNLFNVAEKYVVIIGNRIDLCVGTEYFQYSKIKSAVRKLKNVQKSEKLMKSNTVLQNNIKKHMKPSCYNSSRIFENKNYIIRLLTTDKGYYFELKCTENSEIFFKFIEDLLIYSETASTENDFEKVISRLVKINKKFALLPLGTTEPTDSMLLHSTHGDNSLNSASDPPLFLTKTIKSKEYIIQAFINDESKLKVDFFPTDTVSNTYSRQFSLNTFGQSHSIRHFLENITIHEDEMKLISEIKDLYIKPDELLSIKSIIKVFQKVSMTLYIIYASVVENSVDYNESMIYFYTRVTSVLDNTRVVGIKLGDAYRISGFNEGMLMPMCEYIAKKMIVVKTDEFYIDYSSKPLDIINIVIKIQRYWKGRKLKKCINIGFLIHFSEYFQISKENYKIILYQAFKKEFLVAVKGIQVLKLPISTDLLKSFIRSQDKKRFIQYEVIIYLNIENNKLTYTRRLSKAETLSLLHKKTTKSD